MLFKKPEAGAVVDIAKYQPIKLAKTIKTGDFNGRLHAFAELGGLIFAFIGGGMPRVRKTTLIPMMVGLLVPLSKLKHR